MLQAKRGTFSPPRLLIILNRFVIGGQAADTLPLAYYLKEDFQILIIYGEKEKDEIEPSFLLEKYPRLDIRKISKLRRSINPLTDLFAFFKLFGLIRKLQPDIVHTHGAKSGLLGRIAAYLNRVPVIVHTFHGHFFHSYFSGIVSRLIAITERILSRITTATIALSKAQKDELVRTFKVVPEGKVYIIPLGFDFTDTADHDVYRSNFRNRYKVPDDHVAIGVVGRIVPIKNHLMFLKVIQQILSQHPELPVSFFVVGDGEQRQYLEQWLQEQRIGHADSFTSSNKVVFTSWITSMEEIMTGLDIIALTSLNEGTPLALIEAQYFKKPVVCTDVGGVKDTIHDGQSGFLVASGDVDEFVRQLKRFVLSKALRDKMGEQGRQLVEQRFSKKQEVIITKQFYFSLLQSKGKMLRQEEHQQ